MMVRTSLYTADMQHLARFCEVFAILKLRSYVNRWLVRIDEIDYRYLGKLAELSQPYSLCCKSTLLKTIARPTHGSSSTTKYIKSIGVSLLFTGLHLFCEPIDPSTAQISSPRFACSVGSAHGCLCVVREPADYERETAGGTTLIVAYGSWFKESRQL